MEWTANANPSPIEESLADALGSVLAPGVELARQFQCETRLGVFSLDFALRAGGRLIGIECDGRRYHHPERDVVRDAMIFLDCPVDRILRIPGGAICERAWDGVYWIAAHAPEFTTRRGREMLSKYASAVIREVAAHETFEARVPRSRFDAEIDDYFQVEDVYRCHRRVNPALHRLMLDLDLYLATVASPRWGVILPSVDPGQASGAPARLKGGSLTRELSRVRAALDRIAAGVPFVPHSPSAASLLQRALADQSPQLRIQQWRYRGTHVGVVLPQFRKAILVSDGDVLSKERTPSLRPHDSIDDLRVLLVGSNQVREDAERLGRRLVSAGIFGPLPPA